MESSESEENSLGVDFHFDGKRERTWTRTVARATNTIAAHHGPRYTMSPSNPVRGQAEPRTPAISALAGELRDLQPRQAATPTHLEAANLGKTTSEDLAPSPGCSLG